MKQLFFIIILSSSLSAFPQEKRLALVIGNSAYEHGGVLKNPVNDAIAMNRALSNVGFDVIVHYNLDQSEMKRAIDDFGSRLKNYDVGLFYFAGHGIQSKGHNYLIPVDANLSSENEVEYDCIDAGRLLGKMETADNRTNIIILDACRNNPFERSWTRSAQGRGLASMDAPVGSILAYATAPGKTASDGSGQNGLYTSALIENIITPDIDIESVFKKVRAIVINLSKGNQTPWESTSLIGDFYFNIGNSQNTSLQSLPQMKTIPDAADYKENYETASSGTFLDNRDYQEYSWVKIGNQIWMAENLNYISTYGSTHYFSMEAENELYGRLYTWEAATNSCPTGWHLPSEIEWRTLESYLGMSQSNVDKIDWRGTNEGGKLKKSGSQYWLSPNVNATNATGFSAVPAGLCLSDGTFQVFGAGAYFWTSTEFAPSTSTAWIHGLFYNMSSIYHMNWNKDDSMSVRCIKD